MGVITMIIALRLFIMMISGFLGFYYGGQFRGASETPWLGTGLGLAAGFLIILIDLFFKKVMVKNILSLLLGIALGLVIHKLLMGLLVYTSVEEHFRNQFALISSVVFAQVKPVCLHKTLVH